MRILEPAELLAVWERGYAQQPVERALTLLAAALPQLAAADLVAMPIGRRDAAILALRERNFGRRFTGVTSCPHCGEKVECDFTVDHVRLGQDDPPPLVVERAGQTIPFRLPDSSDLLAVAAARDTDAKSLILERCLGGTAVDEETSQAIAERMEQADPQAHVQLAIACPSCAAVFQRTFDIVSYVWGEIASWAARIVREVDALARAYGWRETDILAMTPWRRQLYLELVQ